MSTIGVILLSLVLILLNALAGELLYDAMNAIHNRHSGWFKNILILLFYEGTYLTMTKEKIVFDCEDALQMKAVAVMIQKASQYHSTIYIVRSGRRANAKSLLGVMSLGIENGAEIEIEANGDDEKEACEALLSHLKNPKLAV